MEHPGDSRATHFLIQKVAIDVQCGSAALLMVTIPFLQSLLLCPQFEQGPPFPYRRG